MTSPDPVPPPLGPLAAIVTTEGTTLLATGVTEQVAPEAPEEASEEAPALALAPDEGVLLVVQPATTPPTTSTAMGTRRGTQRAVPNFRTVGGTMTSPGVRSGACRPVRIQPPRAGPRPHHPQRMSPAGWLRMSQTGVGEERQTGEDAAPG